MVDLLVHGGWVVDGSAAPPVRADVAITGGRIAALGRFDPSTAGLVIDATGRYVLPGFIDAHVHAEAGVLDEAVQLAVLRQGVTTLVLGQDGISYAPATPAALAYVTRYFAGVNGAHADLDDGPVSVAQLRESWRGRTAVNTAFLVPHATVRLSVMGGAERPPDPDELRAMRGLVETGLAEGAVGFSSGLEYLPGRYAGTEELAALCAPVAAAGRPYVTHMRGYGPAAPAALAEVRAIAEGSGVAAHVSHLHGPAEAITSIVDDARAAGIDLTFDSYPYTRGCTILAMVALPRWLSDSDVDRTLDALTDPAVRTRVATETDPALWPRIALAWVPHPQWSWTEGRRLVDAAEQAGRTPAELCLELLVATRLAASTVFDQPPTTTEESVRALLRHPAHMAGSDGIYVGGHPHPRGWGAFARLLGRHVRELGDWSWAQASVHLAAHPARRFGLTDRGLIRPGLAADLAVVDPATVGDRSVYERPRELAQGIDDVVVNGVAVLRAGALTGERPGRPLP
ncbi:MAG: N-acyl-D-amino-acid deacylase family protein [Micromonosporaceae bacterium]